MLGLNDRHSSLVLPTDFYNQTHLTPVAFFSFVHPNLRRRRRRHRRRHRRICRLCIEHVRDKQDSGIPTVRCERHYSTFFMLPCPLDYSTPLADLPLTTAVENTVWSARPERQTLIFSSTYRILNFTFKHTFRTVAVIGGVVACASNMCGTKDRTDVVFHLCSRLNY